MHRIAELNDVVRRWNTEGTIFVTAGIAAMPFDDQAAILERVREFDGFTPDNDPYGEHDFGRFDYKGQTIFWKIDCYDRELKWGSPNPADPTVTRRVLTILLAEEY